MISLVNLYITNDGKVFKISYSKEQEFKPIKELANETVLIVTLAYEVLNRKPWMIVEAWFNRVKLDYEGRYIMSTEEIDLKMRNQKIFGFGAIETKKFDILAIPNAPILPNSQEKQALYNFLKEKYSMLWENSLGIIERIILLRKKEHKKMIDRIKKSPKINKDNGDCPF